MARLKVSIENDKLKLISSLRFRRATNVEAVIERHFAGKNPAQCLGLAREAIARSTSPGPDYLLRLEENEELTEGGFEPQLLSPSLSVEGAFREYGQTELGAVAIEGILAKDDKYISKGWRTHDGTLTHEGIKAFGAGHWRPFRVASNGEESDVVTTSGVLLLPDDFTQEVYSTGDIAHPLAVLHHEIMAHILPSKEAKELEPGLEMELICIRFESDMLRQLGLTERKLNWGQDDGIRNQTLYEPGEQYYNGLVIESNDRSLVEIDPDTQKIIGLAIAVP